MQRATEKEAGQHIDEWLETPEGQAFIFQENMRERGYGVSIKWHRLTR